MTLDALRLLLSRSRSTQLSCCLLGVVVRWLGSTIPLKSPPREHCGQLSLSACFSLSTSAVFPPQPYHRRPSIVAASGGPLVRPGPAGFPSNDPSVTGLRCKSRFVCVARFSAQTPFCITVICFHRAALLRSPRRAVTCVRGASQLQKK